jgi:integrase
VEPEALALMKRIGQGKKHLLASMDRYKTLHDYTRRLNEGLKRMGPVSGKGGNGSPTTTPLFPYLTSYWARHTWATLAAELEIPKETISAALGHEIGSRITSIYIDYDQRKVDAANRRVIDCIVAKKKMRLSLA